MPEPVSCDLCGCQVALHESFVVRIDVFADPSLPPITQEELQTIDSGQKMNELLEQMKGMSTDELQDGVHRRFEHRICAACHREFLSNPLGKPRRAEEGMN
jgi:hypothetical protein